MTNKEAGTMRGALSHIRVLDLSRILAGPWASQTLGDLGAEVIKIERPGSGDDTRSWGPPYLKDREGRDTDVSAYFLCANRNKKSVTVNIAAPEGQEIARDLVRKSDIVIENFRPGRLEEWGLGYAQLSEIGRLDQQTTRPKDLFQALLRPQKGGRVEGAGSFFGIIGLLDDAPLIGPVALQGEDKVLKCHENTSDRGVRSVWFKKNFI